MGTGRNLTLDDRIYIIEYSIWANIMLVVYSCAIPVAMLSVLTGIMWMQFGTEAMYEHWVPFILMYIAIPLLTLPFMLINFMRLHKSCGRYSYEITNNAMVVKDVRDEKIATVLFDEIERYQLVDIGYSVYTAIKLYIKGDRLVFIYCTMTNYRKIGRELKRRNIVKLNYCDVHQGTYLDNVL